LLFAWVEWSDFPIFDDSQNAQKDLPARPQPKKATEAYPQRYVEDAFEVRTKLEGFFSILLQISAVTVPYLS